MQIFRQIAIFIKIFLKEISRTPCHRIYLENAKSGKFENKLGLHRSIDMMKK